MKKPTNIDWAQLAAFIDGEGTIVIIKARLHYTQLVIRVANCDPRLPMWCKRVFGGKVYPYQTSTGRNFYHWATQAQKAENILRECLPYFRIKREQAEVALAYRDTFRHRKGRIPEQELTAGRMEVRRQYREELHRLKLEIPAQAFIGAPEPTKLLQ